jgi:hypothetical protein
MLIIINLQPYPYTIGSFKDSVRWYTRLVTRLKSTKSPQLQTMNTETWRSRITLSFHTEESTVFHLAHWFWTSPWPIPSGPFFDKVFEHVWPLSVGYGCTTLNTNEKNTTHNFLQWFSSTWRPFEKWGQEENTPLPSASRGSDWSDCVHVWCHESVSPLYVNDTCGTGHRHLTGTVPNSASYVDPFLCDHLWWGVLYPTLPPFVPNLKKFVLTKREKILKFGRGFF